MRSKGLVGLTVAAATIALVAGCSGTPGNDADSTPGSAAFGDCDVTENTTTHEIDFKEADVMTWGVPLPAPGAIVGDTPDTVSGGYLYCLVAEIAHRGGADAVKVYTNTWEGIITGADTGFDFTAYDVIITPERKEVIDFSTPYRTYQTVVVATEESDVTEDNFADKRIGTLNGAIQVSWLDENVDMQQQIRVFNSPQDMITALVAGQIDAFIYDADAGITYAAENVEQGLVPVGILPIESSVGIVLEKGSANTAVVNQILADMETDGTLDAIYEQWLYPSWGDFRLEDLPKWDVTS